MLGHPSGMRDVVGTWFAHDVSRIILRTRRGSVGLRPDKACRRSTDSDPRLCSAISPRWGLIIGEFNELKDEDGTMNGANGQESSGGREKPPTHRRGGGQDSLTHLPLGIFVLFVVRILDLGTSMSIGKFD